MHVDWWTLGLQAINVVILIWMMSRFLFRPVATMIAARRAHIDGLMQVAEDKRVQAEKLQADLEGLRYGISAERDQALQAARAAGEEAKAAMLAQAEAEAAEIRKRAADERAREQVAFEERLLRRAADLAVDISARLLKRVAGEQPLQPFLAGLLFQRAIGSEGFMGAW